jgi:hypothetical protein
VQRHYLDTVGVVVDLVLAVAVVILWTEKSVETHK